MAHTNTASKSGELAGVVGFFDEPQSLIEATRKTRDAKWDAFDTFTPYPVHGLETAQGLGRSPLPWVTFGAGLTGCSLGFLLQYWTSAVDWPVIIGGKPFNSWPAFVPVMFACTILFAGLSTLAAMFIINGLPNLKRRIADTSITRDRFAILIEAPGKAKPGKRPFTEESAAEFLKSTGAKEVRAVFAEGWF